MNKTKQQICPRCKEKAIPGQKRCNKCNLIFSRLEEAQNKYAKAEILHHNKQNVVYTSTIPSDVSYIRLLLLAIFGGIFGAHNFYIGRYLKAFYMLVVGIASVILISIVSVSQLYETIASILSIFAGISTLMWLFDLGSIIAKKYKIPVAMEIKK